MSATLKLTRQHYEDQSRALGRLDLTQAERHLETAKETLSELTPEIGSELSAMLRKLAGMEKALADRVERRGPVCPPRIGKSFETEPSPIASRA